MLAVPEGSESPSCADYLALSLDKRFLLARRRSSTADQPSIWDEDVTLEDMPPRTGHEVAEELAGRMLLRYVTEQHPPLPTKDAWLTPTPLGVEGAAVILHLPYQVTERRWVLVIDPSKIEVIKGPRRVVNGQGIEYYLPHAYTAEALLNPDFGVRVR
jgi:hypothetical protein